MRILLLLFLSVCRVCAAEPANPKSLAAVLSEHGVSQDNNTAGHAEERTAENETGRGFDFKKSQLAHVWMALRNASFIEVRTTKPTGSYFFVVLNTGTTGRLDLNRPIEAFWIDMEGNAYFLADHKATPRSFQVFHAPQLRDLMTAFAENRVPPGNYSLSVARVYGSSPSQPEWVFLVGGVGSSRGGGTACKSVASLKKLLAELPQGSTLDWWLSDDASGEGEFAVLKGEIEDLKAISRRAEITFTIHPGG